MLNARDKWAVCGIVGVSLIIGLLSVLVFNMGISVGRRDQAQQQPTYEDVKLELTDRAQRILRRGWLVDHRRCTKPWDPDTGIVQVDKAQWNKLTDIERGNFILLLHEYRKQILRPKGFATIRVLDGNETLGFWDDKQGAMLVGE